MKETKVILIGIGNDYRSDDGVGAFIVRHLKRELPSDIGIFEEKGEGAKLMELWKEATAIFLFDAVYSGAVPGKIYRLDTSKKTIPKGFFNYSTHAFSLAEAIELARALQQLPPIVIIYGVEGKSFESGANLSPEVETAAHHVIRQAKEEILSLKEKKEKKHARTFAHQ